jgi:hypothetical protein
MTNIKVGIYDANGEVKELSLFQLLQWKHAIKLEMETGMKMKGGRSVATHVRRFLSAPRYPIKDLYNHIAASLASINEQLGVPTVGE